MTEIKKTRLRTVFFSILASVVLCTSNTPHSFAVDIDSTFYVPDAIDCTSGSSSIDSILSLTYPGFSDEAAIATAITKLVKDTAPQSPWLTVDANIGQWLIDQTKSRNINPMLIVAIGKQENIFGTVGGSHVTGGHNYFGITDGNGGYRSYSSPTDGMVAMLDKVKKDTQGSDRGNYAQVSNFYEYLGMHQAGKIAYPGEPLGKNGEQDGFDPIMQVYISWTTKIHPNSKYNGQLFNPGIYYKNAVSTIKGLTGLQISDVPTRSGAVAALSGGCGQSSGATFSGTLPGSDSKVIDGFAIYKQGDSEWGKLPYAGGDMASSGCGPTSMAMIITTLTGIVVTPKDTQEFGHPQGPNNTESPGGGSEGVALAEKMAAWKGLKATHLGANIQAINAALQSGAYVIASGHGALPFTDGGHFVVIRKLTSDGKWLVGDSAHRNIQPDTSTTPFDPATMTSDFTAGGYSVYAISK